MLQRLLFSHSHIFTFPHFSTSPFFLSHYQDALCAGSFQLLYPVPELVFIQYAVHAAPVRYAPVKKQTHQVCAAERAQ